MHRTLVVQSGVGVCASWDGEDEDEIMSSVADVESIQTAQDVTSWYVRSTERANAEGLTLSASRVPIGLVWTSRNRITGVMLYILGQVSCCTLSARWHFQTDWLRQLLLRQRQQSSRLPWHETLLLSPLPFRRRFC